MQLVTDLVYGTTDGYSKRMGRGTDRQLFSPEKVCDRNRVPGFHRAVRGVCGSTPEPARRAIRRRSRRRIRVRAGDETYQGDCRQTSPGRFGGAFDGARLYPKGTGRPGGQSRNPEIAGCDTAERRFLWLGGDPESYREVGRRGRQTGGPASLSLRLGADQSRGKR